MFGKYVFCELFVLQSCQSSRPLLRQVLCTNLEYDKAIPLVAPSYYAFVLWVLEHSGRKVNCCLRAASQLDLLTCTTCEPALLIRSCV